MIGERIYGPIGNAVDIFAVVSTVLGVATSLGFGVVQINSGLNQLFGLPINEPVQVLLIVGATALASISVGLGLDAGIRRLSELNIILAILLVLFEIGRASCRESAWVAVRARALVSRDRGG